MSGTALADAPPRPQRVEPLAPPPQRLRRTPSGWLLVCLGTAVLSLVAGVVFLKRGQQPVLGFGLICLVGLGLMWVRFPKAALATTIALSQAGDPVTAYWYPFTKNLSSHESAMYLADRIPFSPFDLVIAAALVMAVYRNTAHTGRPLPQAPLVRPFMVFSATVAGGLLYGLGTGGDFNAALFEARPVIYLPLLYLLVVSVCESRRDYTLMLGAAVAGIGVQALLSVQAVWSTPVDLRPSPQLVMDHGSAVGMNMVFMLLISMLALRSTNRWWTLAIAVISIPMAIMYFESQRRAAVIALIVGLIILAATLFWRQRATFWKLIPAVFVVLAGYVAVMWGSESAAAFPAQAVKSVVAPSEITEANRSSGEYRDIENFNLHFTIRTAPLTGIGFGHAFYRPIPLADISVFPYHGYIAHNSLLWTWTKAGFVGFASFLYLISRTLTLGSYHLRRERDGAQAALSLTAVAFVAMFGVFMYVDIAWGARTAVLLALSMGLCSQQAAATDHASSSMRTTRAGAPA